jgi:hypothetical protein
MLVALLPKNPSSFLVDRVSSDDSNILVPSSVVCESAAVIDSIPFVLGPTTFVLCFCPLCYGYPRATFCAIDKLSNNLAIRDKETYVSKEMEPLPYLQCAWQHKILTPRLGSLFKVRTIIASSKLPREENRILFEF